MLLKLIFIKSCRDINVPNGWEFRKDNEKYQLDFTAPEVEVHCLYGSGIDTVEKYVNSILIISLIAIYKLRRMFTYKLFLGYIISLVYQ